MEKLEKYSANQGDCYSNGVDRVEALAAALNRAPYHREAKDKSKSLRGCSRVRADWWWWRRRRWGWGSICQMSGVNGAVVNISAFSP
jgi:hypothetical protein